MLKYLGKIKVLKKGDMIPDNIPIANTFLSV